MPGEKVRREAGVGSAVPFFHTITGLVIIFGPFYARGAARGFWWVGIGGVLIGIDGLALASVVIAHQLLFGIFKPDLVFNLLAPLLLLMTLAFTYGLVRDSKH